MSKEFDFIKRLGEESNFFGSEKVKNPCFVANSEKMFEFAKDYFKNTGVEVVLQTEAPKDTCYMVSKEDYKSE